MNNANKEHFMYDGDATVKEEEIVLAPPTELFDEAKTIEQNTRADEKFPFALQYDPNEKDFLESMLQKVGAIMESDDEEGHVLSTRMNMTQLAFIKQLDAVERVKTDEGMNPFFAEGAEALVLNPQNELENQEFENEAEATSINLNHEPLNVENEMADCLIADANYAIQTITEKQACDDGIAVASAATSPRSSYNNGPTNTSRRTAATISDESYTIGCICCPYAQQWFKFTATRTGQYTIYTTGPLDTVGTLYDSSSNKIVEVDDYEPCGKLNFRIIQNLTAGNTYYVKVRVADSSTGQYTLGVTDMVLVNEVSINKDTITLVENVTYELPVTPNYTYKGYNGAQPIPGLSVSIAPSNAYDQNIRWSGNYGGILEVSFGWDDDGDRYFHVTATDPGTATLFADDWRAHGKRDGCAVTVVAPTPYEKQLQESGGFSNEEANLILKLYNKVDTIFATENALQKAWKCARLLSEFCYDNPMSIQGIETPINPWDNAAGSVTTNEDRKTYFINTLGYTESEYNKLHDCLTNNQTNANTCHEIMDFTHMQYALAARLAYTLRLSSELSNWGPILYTGNFGRYTDEEVSYLGGWFGDAILTDFYGQGTTSMKNEDYMADLDAENIYRLIIQGYSSTHAADAYYSNISSSNTRADIFLQYIPFNTVKDKIFYELIDAQLYLYLSNALSQEDIGQVQYWSNLINNEQYHYDTIKSNYRDTYNFLKSLEDRRSTMGQYAQ